MTSDPHPGDDQSRRQVTSVDVARAAGVSQTTVSLVVSGRADGRISAPTQDRVRHVAAELGYVPNASAQVLRGGSPRVLALAVPNVRNPYFGHLLVATENAAREQGMAVVLVDNGSDTEWRSRLIEMNRTRLLAGAIVYDEGSLGLPDLIAGIDHLVFVERDALEPVPHVGLGIREAMDDVVDHLFRLGHRRIGHARASMERATFRLRAQYLRESLNQRGITFEERWENRTDYDLDRATAASYQYLKNTDVTAVFCDDDILAASLYRAARRLAITIPDDLSVVGFNDLDLARYLQPELTSVAIPGAEVARSAVDKVLAAINGEAPDSVTVPLTLRVRESTAQPRSTQRTYGQLAPHNPS